MQSLSIHSLLIVAVMHGAAWALPTQFTATPLTPSSTSPNIYPQATLNNTDAIYLRTQSGLRTIKTDLSGDRSLDVGSSSSNAGLNNNGQFVYSFGASNDQLRLSTLASAPTSTTLTSNPLYTGPKLSIVPDMNDNGQIVFNNGGNQLWLTDTAGTFFTNLSNVIGANPDGSSRVSINNAGKIVYSFNGDLFLTDTLGTAPTNLTSSISLNLSSPDINNNGIIVARDETAAVREIWMLDIFGSAPLKMTTRAIDGEAANAQINDLNQVVIPLNPPAPDPSDFRVYLYTPVPEPTSVFLIGAPFIFFTARRFRNTC